VPQDSSDVFRDAVFARTSAPNLTDPVAMYQGGAFLSQGEPMTAHKRSDATQA
jgi:uronate dehydrogenase